MKKLIFYLTFTLVISFCCLAYSASVNFKWDASTGQVDGYKIYWSDVQSGPYPNELCDVNATSLQYTAILDESQEYFLVVRAYNVYGESGDSNEVHWFYKVPGVPGGLYWSIDLSELMKSLGADQIRFVSR